MSTEVALGGLIGGGPFVASLTGFEKIVRIMERALRLGKVMADPNDGSSFAKGSVPCARSRGLRILEVLEGLAGSSQG
jgi:hypothetical protein